MPPGSGSKFSSSIARRKRAPILVDKATSSREMPRCSRSRFKRAPNDATATLLCPRPAAPAGRSLKNRILIDKYKVGVGPESRKIRLGERDESGRFIGALTGQIGRVFHVEHCTAHYVWLLMYVQWKKQAHR